MRLATSSFTSEPSTTMRSWSNRSYTESVRLSPAVLVRPSGMCCVTSACLFGVAKILSPTLTNSGGAECLTPPEFAQSMRKGHRSVVEDDSSASLDAPSSLDLHLTQCPRSTPSPQLGS